jgi:hypothetical protein
MAGSHVSPLARIVIRTFWQLSAAMLTANQLRQVAARSGARDIGNVEIDVILTYLLQLFAEKGITAHVAFKGGTMLRKIVFGPRGRLSTDLDFTCHTDIDISADDLMLMMLEAVDKPCRCSPHRIMCLCTSVELTALENLQFPSRMTTP